MIAALLLGLAPVQSAPLLIERPAGDRPALLILGTPHLANHNRDVVNTQIGDILSPARQHEIEAVVDRLAAFRPTRVAVEIKPADQPALDRRYADYRAGRYTLTADEVDQIGLRLAAKLGLPRVDAVNWNDSPPGVEADYNYLTWAKANGAEPRFEKMRSLAQAESKAEEARMACSTVGDWLRRANAPHARVAAHRRYFDYAMLGDSQTSPGATWVGNWYARNLRIFANLVRLAPNPADRVVVIYGSGHAPLLDQFSRESGAFAVAETLAHLPPERNPGSNCR